MIDRTQTCQSCDPQQAPDESFKTGSAQDPAPRTTLSTPHQHPQLLTLTDKLLTLLAHTFALTQLLLESHTLASNTPSTPITNQKTRSPSHSHSFRDTQVAP
jgi:hypothetical protein